MNHDVRSFIVFKNQMCHNADMDCVPVSQSGLGAKGPDFSTQMPLTDDDLVQVPSYSWHGSEYRS